MAAVAVVTGAGSGLGRALARRLDELGWDLVLVGRRRSRLEAVRHQLMGENRCLVIEADVGDVSAADGILRATVERFGRIDALINNAGLARFAPLENSCDLDIEQMVRTNFTGPLSLVRAAANELAAANGTVVNVGSIGGLLALPDRAAYGATKAALHHLTRSLARELAPEVRVNAVAPGAIDTEMYADLGLGPADVARLRNDLRSTTPLGRMGTVDDVVPWIELLLGPAGSWVTGAVLVIDGGRSC